MFFLKNKNFATLLSIALLPASIFVACVKTDFDEPPVGGDGKDIPTNTTIRDLKKLHVGSGTYDKITEDLVIGGVVVMDDRSGNFYKTLVIQDSTGGIEVKFNDGYLYNRYPVGRKIYIRCKDLILTDYNGLPQLTGSTIQENGVPTDVGITEVQEREKIVKGFLGNAPAPKVIGLNQLSNDLVSTLVQIDAVQFVTCDAGKTYADAITKTSINRTLEDCNGRELLLRSSGFANFASDKTPLGKGTIVGVLSKYGSDYQLYIRDLTDVLISNNQGDRCGGNGSGGNGVLTNISDIRAYFTGSPATLPADLKIKGIVISDRLNNNLNNRNLYVQDASGGIVVRFLAPHCYDLGDEIEVNVSGQEVSEFNGLRQVNNVPLENAVAVSTGKTVAPRVATVAEINANFNNWESTLVQIKNVTITGGATFSGNRTVTDASGNIAMFTQSGASFSSVALPSGPVTLTAIVSDYNGKQIILRNINDVQQ
ncbi:MAG: hypothetical protein OHK0019_10430 [Saprospiraceae bacterium]